MAVTNVCLEDLNKNTISDGNYECEARGLEEKTMRDGNYYGGPRGLEQKHVERWQLLRWAKRTRKKIRCVTLMTNDGPKEWNQKYDE